MVIIQKDFKKHSVRVHPFKPDDKECVAYDLHVGRFFLDPGKERNRPMPDEFRLSRGHCIRIAAEEEVSLPGGIFGQVCSKASLGAMGLYVGNTKIDPHYSGKLRVPVFNAGSRSLLITKGDPFCSVFFHTLERAVANNAPRRSPDMPLRKESRLRSFLSDHASQIATVVFAAILSAAGAYAATRAALVEGRAGMAEEQSVEPNKPLVVE